MMVARPHNLGQGIDPVTASLNVVSGILQTVKAAFGFAVKGQEKRMVQAQMRTELQKQQSRERLAIIGGGLVLGALILTRRTS